MRAFGILFKRELGAFFLSVVGYIFVIVLLVLLDQSFGWVLDVLTGNAGETSQQQIVGVFFGGNIFFWMWLVVAAPALTMRLFSEEKRAGTIEVLLTTPVSDLQVVLAKFLGALAIFTFLLMPTVLYFALLGPKHLDWGMLGSAYLGTLLLGAMFIAIGCLVSALCTNQFMAATLCSAVVLGLSFGPLLFQTKDVDVEWLKTSVRYISLLGEDSVLGDFSRGMITVAHLVYPLSLTACSLFLTCKVLASRAWK